MTRLLGTLVAAALLVMSAACGGGDDGGPQAAASSFEKALAADDGGTACTWLAPRTRSELEKSAGAPCPEAILEEDLPRVGASTGTATYGAMAQVHFAEDTLFLAEFGPRWLVTAAGCRPVPEAPYDCTIQGG